MRKLSAAWGIARMFAAVLLAAALAQPGEACTGLGPNQTAGVGRSMEATFFDSATSPMVFWAPLFELGFKEGAPAKRLTLIGGKTYAGSAAAQFEPMPPFGFLPANP